MIVELAAVILVWLVGCGWLVVLHLRSRMALPDEPAPMPTLHVVTGSISLAALAFLAIYALTPTR